MLRQHAAQFALLLTLLIGLYAGLTAGYALVGRLAPVLLGEKRLLRGFIRQRDRLLVEPAGRRGAGGLAIHGSIANHEGGGGPQGEFLHRDIFLCVILT